MQCDVLRPGTLNLFLMMRNSFFVVKFRSRKKHFSSFFLFVPIFSTNVNDLGGSSVDKSTTNVRDDPAALRPDDRTMLQPEDATEEVVDHHHRTRQWFRVQH